jgi:predicted Ser/Thr protein kinase
MNARDRLGWYEIVALIGKGGMGEVYRAFDPKLGREVAIKILPGAFAQDADRMARFEREAKVLASLNHPNIAQIYGVEQSALVMELVEGETLKGPLPLEMALNYAKQIGEALEAAHEKGIVHRDLKPENIKITPQGVVKVLDFGLAKAAEEQMGDAEHSPTLTISPTRAGLILGTAAYMSPEQARGKVVDKRADIWAFGVVLYEMLTAQRLFKGDTISDTLAAVLKEEPDLEQVPPKVRRLLAKCLEKDPKRRLRDIGDACELLEDRHTTTPSQTRLGWAVGVLGLVAATILAFIHFREAPRAKTVLRYAIATPENTTHLHSFAISTNGRLVAMAADANGKRQLWLRAMDELKAQPIPSTDDAIFPFWSPDSSYIGFFAQGKLKKIAAGGGPAQALCDAPDGRGGSWNRENVILFSPESASGVIQSVSAAGGVPVDVARGTRPLYPLFLPDQRHFLYVVNLGPSEEFGNHLSSLDKKEREMESRRVLNIGSSVVFGAGRLLFIRDNTLMAQPFDTASGQTVGEVAPVAENISTKTTVSYTPVSVSETGVLLYENSDVASNQGGLVRPPRQAPRTRRRARRGLGAFDLPG